MVWTHEQARRAILLQQGLTLRDRSVEEALKKVTVVQTQYAISLYPALFARATTTLSEVERLLKSERNFVKTWANRHTVHTFHRDDFPVVVGALGPAAYRRFLHWCNRQNRFGTLAYDQVAEDVLDALSDGPLERSELHRRVSHFDTEHHWGWGVDVMGLAYRGDLVFAEQGGTRTAFARRDLWLGDLPTCDQPQQALVQRYLTGHGPATLADFLYWSGLQVRDAKAALEFMRFECKKVITEDAAGAFVHPEAPALDDLPPCPPRLLAKFDPLLMGWRNRARFLHPKVTSRVVRPAGQIEATVLLDDQIRGTWRLRRSGKRVTLRIAWFSKPGARSVKSVEREALSLCAGWGFSDANIEHCEDETA